MCTDNKITVDIIQMVQFHIWLSHDRVPEGNIDIMPEFNQI